MWAFIFLYFFYGYFVVLFYFISNRKTIKQWDLKQQIINFVAYWVGWPILVGYLFIKYSIKIFVLDI